MHTVQATSYDDLQAMLARLGTTLSAHEVHALFLGALTSARVAVGPEKLLELILRGVTPKRGGERPDINGAVGVLFGYWNTLNAAREAGEVRFAPDAPDLTGTRDRSRLLAFAERRAAEIRSYARGITESGDDPTTWGDDAHGALKKLVQQGEAFAGVSTLEAFEPTDAGFDHVQLLLVQGSEQSETLISLLMDMTDVIRMGRLAGTIPASFQGAQQVPSIASPKVGRNERCPCGSGKKWKQCCGARSRA
jgi:hypothetical protein